METELEFACLQLEDYPECFTLDFDPGIPENSPRILLGVAKNLLDWIINILEKTPVFEQYTKNAILLLMEDMPNEPATLMEIPRVFTDEEYRNKKLARIKNPVVIDFWEKEALQASAKHPMIMASLVFMATAPGFVCFYNDYYIIRQRGKMNRWLTACFYGE